MYNSLQLNNKQELYKMVYRLRMNYFNDHCVNFTHPVCSVDWPSIAVLWII